LDNEGDAGLNGMGFAIEIAEAVGFRSTVQTTSYTAISFEWVIASNAATITFPQYPEDGDEIIITVNDTSSIPLAGNGKTIAGCPTGTLREKFLTIHFKFALANDTWYPI